MSLVIDKNRVGESFHRQAIEYDQHAKVQLKVVHKLLEIVGCRLDIVPSTILDVGCGTGRLLSELHQTYPAAALNGIDLAQNMVLQAKERLGDTADVACGDAEQLPFNDNTFDLIVSSSTLQWLETTTVFMKESYRVMKNGGLLCCAFFGGSTLHEVQQCYRDVITTRCGESDSRLGRLHRFKTLQETNEILQASAFEQFVLTSELEVEYYFDLNELLRSIQKIGAGTASGSSISKKGGLGWRGLLHEMSDLYQERYGKNGKIPANYEVFYLTARKISSKHQ